MPVAYDQRTLPLSRNADNPAAAGLTLAWDFTGMGSLPEAQPFLFGGEVAPTLTVSGNRTYPVYNGIQGVQPGGSGSAGRYDNTSFLGQGLQIGTEDFQVALIFTTGPTLPTVGNTIKALVIRNDAGTALVDFTLSESSGNGWFLNANSSTGEGSSITATMYGTNKTLIFWFRRRSGVTNVWTQEVSPSGVLVSRYNDGSDSTAWTDTSAKRIYIAWNTSSTAVVDCAIHGVRFWGGTSLDDATTQAVGRDIWALEANSVASDNLTITSPDSGSTIPLTTTFSGTYTGNAPSGVDIQHGSGSWLTLSGFSATGGTWSGSIALSAASSAPIRARYSNNPSVVSADIADITVEANSIAFTVPSVGGGYPDPAGAVPYRLFQRDGSDQAPGVRITGAYDGTPTSIQWRHNGGTWATLIASPSGGEFDATVTLQGPSQGPLEVRFSNETAVSAALSQVGVGDVYIAGGQSNAAGWSPSFLQPVPPLAHPGWQAIVFDLGHVWRVNEETSAVPFHDPAIAVYPAFGSGGGSHGSYYGHLATLAMSSGVPIAVVPAARGSTDIDMWAADTPGSTSTLFGALLATANRIGNFRNVLWWQGEASMTDDSIGTSLDPSLYPGKLGAIIDAWVAQGRSEKWILTMMCLARPIATTAGATFRTGMAGMSSNPNVAGILDLDVPTPAYNSLHYEGSAEMTTIAERMSALLGYTTVGTYLTGSATSSSQASATLSSLLNLGLSGSALASAQAQAELSATLAIQGASIASALATGQLHALVALAGNASSASVGTAALSAGVSLLGAALTLGTADGQLSAQIPLTGSAASMSVATGDLHVQASGGGSATSQSSATGQISVSTPLTGAAQALTDANASLNVSVRLSGQSVTAAVAEASVSVGTPLYGQAGSQSNADGELTVSGTWNGSASSASIASGQLSVLLELSGAALASAQAVGILAAAADVKLSGGATVSSVGDGVIEIKVPLLGQALVATLAEGQPLVLSVALAGAAVATSSASGYLGSRPVTVVNPRRLIRRKKRFDVIDVAQLRRN